MSWLILFIAGLLEVVWAVGLKYTHGFSRLVPSVITIVAMIASMALLSWAMKSLPVGTAYAVWTGIGAVGAAITGILLLGESASPMRIASLALGRDGQRAGQVVHPMQAHCAEHEIEGARSERQRFLVGRHGGAARLAGEAALAGECRETRRSAAKRQPRGLHRLPAGPEILA